MVKVMVSGGVHESNFFPKYRETLGFCNLEPHEVFSRLMAGHIISDIFALKPGEDSIPMGFGRTDMENYIGTQFIVFSVPGAGIAQNDSIGALSAKPSFAFNPTGSDKTILVYILDSFVYGLEARNKVMAEIAEANGFSIDTIKAEKPQFLYGSNKALQSTFFKGVEYHIKEEQKGSPRGIKEQIEGIAASEMRYNSRKNWMMGNESLISGWDDSIYQDTIDGTGWDELRANEELVRHPDVNVRITGRMGQVRIPNRKTLVDGVWRNAYKYTTIKYKDGEGRRNFLWESIHKIVLNYTQLYSKNPNYPKPDSSVIFHIVKTFAPKVVELVSKNDTITLSELADMTISVLDDDAKFIFSGRTESPRASAILPSKRFDNLSASEIIAVITYQLRIEDILKQYHWDMSPTDNLAILNTERNYAGRELSKDSLCKLLVLVGKVLKKEKNKRKITYKDIQKLNNKTSKNIKNAIIYDFDNFNNFEISYECVFNYFLSFSDFFIGFWEDGNTAGWKYRKAVGFLKSLRNSSLRKLSLRKLSSLFFESFGFSVSYDTLARARRSIYGAEPSESPRNLPNLNNNNNINNIYFNNNIYNLSDGSGKIVKSDKNCTINCTINPSTCQKIAPYDFTIQRLISGQTAKQISEELGLSLRTIKSYISRAKESGSIKNEGYGKASKWVLVGQDENIENLKERIQNI